MANICAIMIREAGFTFFSKVLAAGFNFLTIITLSRLLGPEGRGICGFYVLVVVTQMVFTDLAGGSTVVYLATRYPVRQLRKISYAWSAALALLVALAFTLGAALTANEFVLLTLSGWLQAGLTLHLNLMLYYRKILVFNILSVLGPAFVWLFFLLLCTVLSASPTLYLLAWLGAGLVVWGAGIYFLSKMPVNDVEPASLGSVAKAALAYGGTNQAGHLVAIVNSRFAYYLFPASALGVYANAVSLTEALLLLPTSTGQIMYSNLVHHAVGGSKEKIVLKNMWMVALLVLAGAVMLFLIPDGFYATIFGAAFKGVSNYVHLLAPGALFYSIYLVGTYYFSARGLFANNVLAGVAGLLANAAGCLTAFGIGELSPYWVAGCWSAGGMVCMGTILWQLRR